MMVRVARLVLARLLPDDVRDAVLADLDAEFRTIVLPAHGRVAGAFWYLSQVVRSVGPAIEMRRRRAAQKENRMTRWSADALRDAAFSLRMLRVHRGFASAAVATLALGIAAATTVFSIVDVVLLRPLPYRDAGSLVRVWSSNPHGILRNRVSPADFFDWRDQASDADLAAFVEDDATLTSGGDAVLVPVANATANLAQQLGAPPLIGRWFTAEEAGGKGSNVVVLGERLWHERFSADPAMLGRAIVVDGTPRTVVGIMPRRFAFPSDEIQMWLPLPDDWRSASRDSRYLGVVGRTPPGQRPSWVAERLRVIATRLDTAYPRTNHGWSVTVLPLRDSLVGTVRTPLLILLIAVAGVLLIACANVSGLLLARAVARRREFAVRAAVGASRARLLRQQIVESSVLSLAGGAAGLVLSAWALGAVRAARVSFVPLADRLGFDTRVAAVAAIASAIAAVAAGILPALRAARGHDAGLLMGGDRVASGNLRSRQALVFVEVAAATVLLAGGGVLLHSFARISGVAPGFDPDALALLATVSLPSPRYAAATRAAFFDRVLHDVHALPGVQAAGAGGPLPLSGQDGLWRFGLVVDGRAADPARSDRAYLRWATPGYFAALGIPLRGGRTFTAADAASAPAVAVIDETLAQRFFANENPIGKRLRTTNERGWRVVIGVVGAVRQTALDRDADPHVYVPEAQMPSPSLTLVVRTAGDPRQIAPLLREAVSRTDASIPLANVRTLDDLVAGSVATRRFSALALASFAAAALLLTVVGIYGVVAQAVAESAHEIGIRLALGADTTALLRSTAGGSLRLVLGAMGAGLVAAWAASPVLAGMLFDVTPRDPVAFVGAAAILSVTALAASYLPARQVISVDAASVLR